MFWGKIGPPNCFLGQSSGIRSQSFSVFVFKLLAGGSAAAFPQTFLGPSHPRL